MELVTEVKQESKIGSQEFQLEAGKSLKIEISPMGVEILNFEADKVYTVRILIHITEG